MANFAVTEYSTEKQHSVALALAALKAKIETVDNTKTLRFIGVHGTGRDREQCVGSVIYDT